MEIPDNVVVFQLTSGTLVISEVVQTQEEEVILKYPLEMNFQYEEEGATRLYLNRWMPYNEEDLVTINTRTIESKTVCSEKYRVMYGTRISHFKEILESSMKYISNEQKEDEEQEPSTSDTLTVSRDSKDTLH